ncbi:ECF transporter S component, partial [uncultured Clostridium sp.]|uniref:ECF transporter S component n=1 Tax=uncultured Clostridium sp. TaxID=59620 RepID=UPI0025FFF2E7
MNNLNVIQNKKINDKRNVISVRNLVIVGMMGAISTILMLFEFGIPFSPSFVKMDFSELPVILGGFLMGPIEGFLIIVIKIVLNFLLNGTSTFGIGELSNMMVSVGY